jgi:Calcium binding
MKRSRDPKLEKLIEEATVDTYGAAEQMTGFYTLIEETVEFPFIAKLVGEPVEVLRVDLDESGEDLVAVCRRGRKEYRIRLLELEIPNSVLGGNSISAFFQYSGW